MVIGRDMGGWSKIMKLELHKIDNEIAKHKWILSESAGHDIGWREARIDWLVNHFRDYVKAHPTIEDDKISTIVAKF